MGAAVLTVNGQTVKTHSKSSCYLSTSEIIL